jgi:hypothetical protein
MLSAPIPAEMPAAAKVYRIGALSVPRRDRQWHVIQAFEESVPDLGCVEGPNVVFEHRLAEGSRVRSAEA